MSNHSKLSHSISICLPIGGYSAEDFAGQRIQWLSKVVDDINAQTLQPTEVVAAINGHVSSKYISIIEDILHTISTPLVITKSQYSLSAAQNWERAIQCSTSKYFSVWSDHDRHTKEFLEVLISEHQTCQNLALVSSLFSHLNEDDIPIQQVTSLCDPVNASSSIAAQRLKTLLRSNLIGAVYGVFSRAHYQLCSRRFESLGPDIILTYEIAQYGGVKILEPTLWSERSRTNSTVPTSQRHSEFYNPISLVPSCEIPITHHLLTCYQIFSNINYFNCREQRSLRHLSMERCEWYFTSFACVREIKCSLGLARKSLNNLNSWRLISIFSIISFQLRWLLHLILSRVLYVELKSFVKRRLLLRSSET